MNSDTINFNKIKFSVEKTDEAGESIIAEIFKHREYRRAEWSIKQALPNEFIIDAGAHQGFFSLYVSALNKKSKIVCLEPNPKNFELVKKNIKNNNAIALNVGLAGVSGKRKLFVTSDSHDSSFFGKENEKINTIECSVISLSDLVNKLKIKKIALLKMDIEGAEFEVLEKMPKEVSSRIKYIMFEYHDFAKNSHKKLELILREYGFSVQSFPSKFEKKLGFIFAKNKKYE